MKLPTHLPDGESIASFLSRVPRQKDPEKQALLDSLLNAVTATFPPKINLSLSFYRGHVYIQDYKEK